MELAIFLMILVVVIAVGAVKLNDSVVAFPFRKKANLFTDTERSFLELIEVAVGHQYRVLCRVRLADVLAVRPSTDRKTSRTALSRASGKQLDFILCSKQDMSPVVAIDLVHQKGKDGYKTQRDWFISGSLDAASIPHVRIKVKAGYKPQDIRDVIEAKLAPIRYKEPKAPIVKGTVGKEERKGPRIRRPIAA